MIPQAFINDLLSRVDIVEVVRSRVQLKRAGKEWSACCPFHDEKSPSFSVSPSKQFYHCFGCGAHGNAVGFLMEFDRLEFPAAVEQLAQDAGIPMPEPEQARGQSSDSTAPIFTVLDQAQSVFRSALKRGTAAADYLDQRGLSSEIAETFGLGYAPSGWSTLTDQLKERRAAEAAGLLIRKDGGSHYDRFRDRLTFPIRDLRGRVVGFGGRTLVDDKAKYLNSPETPVFHKGRLVYGLYEARQASRQLDRLLVVEGYMDVIALAQFGFPFAVATLGTATTTEHMQLLLRQCPAITFCFDGDAAGRRAAFKALDVALQELRDGVDIRFAFLPDGDDPDSLVRREGAAGLSARLGAATPLSELLLQQLSDGVDLSTADGQAALLSRARQALEPVHATAFRQIMLDRITEQTRLQSGRVRSLIGQGNPKERPRRQRVEPPQRMTPARRAIALLLQYPEAASAEVDVDALANSGARGAALLVELLRAFRADPRLRCGAVLQQFAERPESVHLQRLALVNFELAADDAIKDFAQHCKQLIDDPDQARIRMAELSARRPSELTDEEKVELAELAARR